MYKVIVVTTTTKYQISKTRNNIIATSVNSIINGIIENSINLSRKSTPLTPRSITRLNPPVLRDMWYLRDNAWICSKVSKAKERKARWATFAKITSRNSPNPTLASLKKP